MSTIAREDFTKGFFTLLKETFEGPPPRPAGSTYLDKGAGLFQTLEPITAEQASTPARPGGPTIAGHCEHLRFYIQAIHNFMHGARDEIDWQESWQVKKVTPAEWDDLRKRLRREYDGITEHIHSIENWGDQEVADGMAVLVHSAYHLSAIRQLVRGAAQPVWG